MKKITLISLYYEVNRVTGANKRMFYFGKELQERDDIDLTIVVRAGEQPEWAKKVITLPRFDRMPKFLRRFIYFLYITKLCWNNDDIIINDFMPIPIFQGKNKKFFQLVHDIRNFTDYNRAALKVLSSNLQKLQWQKVQNILTVSNFTKKQLVTYCDIKPEKIYVSYNGVVPVTFTEQHERINDFLYIATFEKRKNHENLILALNKYKENVDENVKLVLVGRDLGYKNRILDVISNNELLGNIEIIESISEQELQSLYLKTKCFISPSFYEGFGMPIIESMLYQCNVICSNIEVFQEIAQEHAIYFDPSNVDDIYNKMKSVKDRTNGCPLSIDYVNHKFTWRSIVNDFLKLVK